MFEVGPECHAGYASDGETVEDDEGPEQGENNEEEIGDGVCGIQKLLLAAQEGDGYRGETVHKIAEESRERVERGGEEVEGGKVDRGVRSESVLSHQGQGRDEEVA